MHGILIVDILRALEPILDCLRKIIDTVLTILVILSARRILNELSHFGIPLAKLLERKAAVPKDLSRDTPTGLDLYCHVGHFKWRPMLVLDEVLEKFR